MVCCIVFPWYNLFLFIARIVHSQCVAVCFVVVVVVAVVFVVLVLFNDCYERWKYTFSGV